MTYSSFDPFPRARYVPPWRVRDLDVDLDMDMDDDEYDDCRHPSPPLTLGPEQRAALVAAIEVGLREQGCDNTLRAAQRWAAAAGLDWPALLAQLEGNGGYCDCEVLFNVLPPEEAEPD